MFSFLHCDRRPSTPCFLPLCRPKAPKTTRPEQRAWSRRCDVSEQLLTKARQRRVPTIAARAPEQPRQTDAGTGLGRRSPLSNALLYEYEARDRVLTYHDRRAAQGLRLGRRPPSAPWLEIGAGSAVVKPLAEITRKQACERAVTSRKWPAGS